MKLVLDGTFWMLGGDIEIKSGVRHRHFTEREVYFAYEIRFETNHWQPNHLVTLRTNEDGWGRDIYGVFRHNAWTFLLDRANYSNDFGASFVVDRHCWMNGRPLAITSGSGSYSYDDGDIAFANSPSAFRHGYDNFMPSESPLEQVTVRSAGIENELYDVVVIGSGMGGGILADALADCGVRTLVLEAGSLWFPVHMNELPGVEVDLARRDEVGHYVNLQGSELVYGVQFNFGGRSIYWSGVIPRVREWEMRGKWPESVRNYLMDRVGGKPSGYDRAEKLLRKGKTLGPFQDRVRRYLRRALGGDFEVIDLPRSLHQPNVNESGQIQNVLEKPTGVFSTADLLLDSLGFSVASGRTNLRVNLHQLATRIETEKSNVTAVTCQDLIGKVERRYRGRYVVLTCGSMESPKLAINSGLKDKNGKMGKGLTDHPAYFYNIHHELPRTGPRGWIGDSRGHAKLLIRRQNSTASRHAYNIEVLINPKYWDARHADDDLWKQLIDAQKVSKVEVQFKFSSALDEGNFIRPLGVGRKPEIFVTPNQEGTAFRADVVKDRNTILTALGITGLSDTWIDDEWGLGVQGTPHHAGGTLRMSGDSTGVVDEYLRFHEYDNLYCCDNSVFPTIPAANPSLTVAALALRLADTLAARLGRPCATGKYHV
jgi:choline dehydrogenase-like flavoprotein